MLLLAVVSLGTFLAAYLTVSAFCRRRPVSEAILLAALLSALAIQLETMSLTLFPIPASTRILGFLHVGLILLASTVARRLLRSRGIPNPLGQLLPAALDFRSKLGILGKLALTAILAVLASATAWGFVTAPGGVDELAYHVPQAVGIYQHGGRLVRFDNPLPWVYAYPQGAAMLWAWTMEFTKSDVAFHAVQAALGGQLLLAVYVLARRSGANRDASLVVAATLGCMPVFFRMTTLSTADIGYAASILTMLAFLAPSDPNALGSDHRLAALAFAEACLLKLPILAAIFGITGLLHAAARGRERPARFRARLSTAWALVFVVCAAAISSYILNFVRYDNPAYPLHLQVPGLDFAGPLRKVTDNTIGAHTTFGEVAEMNRAELWAASLFDWGQPLNEDSLGSFGPAVALPMTGLAALGLAWAVRRRDSWLLALGIVCTLCFLVIPGLFLPRYGLTAIATMAVLAAVALSRLPRLQSVGAAVLLLVSGIAVLPVYRLTNDSIAWMAANAAPVPWWEDRGRAVAEQVRIGDPLQAQSPALVRYIRNRVEPKSLLVWNISGYATLLWNRNYTNRILYLPCSAADRYPTEARALTPPTPSELERWLNRLMVLKPQYIVVYTQSAYPAAVKSAGLSYAVDFQDPVSDGKLAVTVLRRRVPPAGDVNPSGTGARR